jgi:hypothetical protein
MMMMVVFREDRYGFGITKDAVGYGTTAQLDRFWQGWAQGSLGVLFTLV